MHAALYNPASLLLALHTLQALAAHLVNVWDKALLYSSAVRATGAGPWWHILFTLGLRGGITCSRPVLQENLGRVMRSGFIVHVSSYEDPDDVNSDTVRHGVAATTCS